VVLRRAAVVRRFAAVLHRRLVAIFSPLGFMTSKAAGPGFVAILAFCIKLPAAFALRCAPQRSRKDRK
jgi:hypothetical protein